MGMYDSNIEKLRKCDRQNRKYWFFFQAEDGIRDLVRSRGLGDVYKRQALIPFRRISIFQIISAIIPNSLISHIIRLIVVMPVSYTHLTLPTSDLV